MKRRRQNLGRRRPALRRQARFAPFVAPRQRYRNPRLATALGIELKFYDTSLTGGVLVTSTDASGGEFDPSATIKLNTVIRGDGEENRDGKQISMKNLSIRGNISYIKQTNQTASDVAPVIFIALVLDTQTNGVTLNSEDVFHNQSAAAINSTNVFRNLLLQRGSEYSRQRWCN